MARKGVTYEQVVEAAKAIEAEGENPTIQRVCLLYTSDAADE